MNDPFRQGPEFQVHRSEEKEAGLSTWLAVAALFGIVGAIGGAILASYFAARFVDDYNDEAYLDGTELLEAGPIIDRAMMMGGVGGALLLGIGGLVLMLFVKSSSAND